MILFNNFQFHKYHLNILKHINIFITINFIKRNKVESNYEQYKKVNIIKSNKVYNYTCQSYTFQKHKYTDILFSRSNFKYL